MDDMDLSSIMVQSDPAPEPIKPEPKQALAKKEMPVKEEPVESEDRSRMITKLEMCFTTFGTKISKLKPKGGLDKLSDDELAALQKQIEGKIGGGGVDGMAAMVPGGLKMVEDLLAELTPLRIQGTHLVCGNADVQDLIKYSIIDLGLGNVGNAKPQVRLALLLLTRASQQHMINSTLEAMPEDKRQATIAALTAQQQGQRPPPKPADDDRFADL